jgi:hypothetical protein
LKKFWRKFFPRLKETLIPQFEDQQGDVHPALEMGGVLRKWQRDRPRVGDANRASLHISLTLE